MTSKSSQKNDDVILEDKIMLALDTLDESQGLVNESERLKMSESLRFLREEVKKSTEAMSSVPKPLKFMRPHYERVKSIYQATKLAKSEEAEECRRLLADLLSVLATTLPTTAPVLTDTGLIKKTVDTVLESRSGGNSANPAMGLNEVHQKHLDEKENKSAEKIERLSVIYRLEGNASNELMAFGHEYIRSLQMDVIAELNARRRTNDEDDEQEQEGAADGGVGRFDTNDKVIVELLEMTRVIAMSLYKGGSFIDATDLMLEMNIAKEIPSMVMNFSKDVVPPLRVAEYLSQSAVYERTEDTRLTAFSVGFTVLLDAQLYSDAIRALLTAHSAGIIDRMEYIVRLTHLMHSTYNDLTNGRTHRYQILFAMCHANVHRMMTIEERELVLKPPENYICDESSDELEKMENIIGSKLSSQHFKFLIEELDLVDAKHPDDVYKTYLDNYTSSENLDSANKNLASSYVSGFVHAGYMNDVIVNPTTTTESTSNTNNKPWIHKHKDDAGTAAAAAVIGALYLCNEDEGLNIVDPYLSSDNPGIQAGGYLGWGLVCCKQDGGFDPLLHQAASLLCEEEDDEDMQDDEEDAKETTVDQKAAAETESGSAAKTSVIKLDKGKEFVKLCSLISLGFAYGGSYKSTLIDVLEPVCLDTEPCNLPLTYNSALVMGLSHVGSGDENISEFLCQVVLDLFTQDLNPLDKDYDAIFLAVGLALNYMGTRSQSDTVASVLSSMGDSCAFRRGAVVLLEACAYVGTCDLSIVQRFLRVISDGADVDTENEDIGEDNKDTTTAEAASTAGADADADEDESKRFSDRKSKSNPKVINQHLDRRLAVLGISLVCLGDKVGQQMILKYAESLLQHGDLPIVRTIPLALALTFASNPQNMVMDLLSKMAHDTDAETALTAIFSLGVVSAGTNNARAAKMFRQLALFYQKSTHALFLVRMCQGLVHLGKGLLTISPVMYGGDVIKKSTLGHLLTVILVGFNMQKHLLDGHHHLYLWHLVAASNPRMLMLLDSSSFEPVPLSLRVGQAVNTVGVAGNPRSVTGFQTHTSPVIIGQGEQAEIDQSGLKQQDENEDTEPSYQCHTSSLEGIVLVTKPLAAAVPQDEDCEFVKP
eukprot:GHVH01004306.1.p1 GENE.GHVH01004306.1~~GHVH01004306.1.p1  ORF type:complete len:1107 (+),score=189.95 GHVH01004306.1:83-3403(+)